MRRIYLLLITLWLGGLMTGMARAGEFKLMDSSTIYGDVSALDENGVVFKLRTGGFSERISWSKFSQEALKELSSDAKAKEFAEPFIEIPPESRPKPKPKPVVLREVTRTERPAGRTTFFSSLTSPMGLLLGGLLYVANLFAAFEIAKYRNRPVAVVCGMSALLPLVGPLIFLASPTLADQGTGGDAAVEPPVVGESAAAPAAASAGSAAARTTSRSLGTVGVPPPASGTGLKVASQAKEAGGAPGEVKVFKRAEFTFNRRFLETQFSGFFRIVPGEAEKDMVLVFKTARQDYLAKRISRISSNEVFLVPLQTGGKEINVGFGEIAEIQIRHKDTVG